MTELLHLSTLLATALVTLAVGVVASRWLLSGLRRLAVATETQRVCFEKFYDGLSRVLKETSDEKQFEMRRGLVLLAEKLSQDKGGFAKFYFIKNRNAAKPPKELAKQAEVIGQQMAGLPDALKTKLAETIGHGLVASTYDLPFSGWLVRAGMKMDTATQAPAVVHEPENVLTRASAINLAHHGRHNDHTPDLVAC